MMSILSHSKRLRLCRGYRYAANPIKDEVSGRGDPWLHLLQLREKQRSALQVCKILCQEPRACQVHPIISDPHPRRRLHQVVVDAGLYGADVTQDLDHSHYWVRVLAAGDNDTSVGGFGYSVAEATHSCVLASLATC